MADRTAVPAMNKTLKGRLLQDIAEIEKSPYRNVTFRFQDDDITRACLILNAKGYGLMHLTVEIPSSFPLDPPRIRMDSSIEHPNIYGDYVCASILNTLEGYTPAYTLKGIAIQLLSFFGSDSIEQDYGGKVDLGKFKKQQHENQVAAYKCETCGHGKIVASGGSSGQSALRKRKTMNGLPFPEPFGRNGVKDGKLREPSTTIRDLPNEVLLLVCDKLETEELWRFKEAWSHIGTVITDFDIIRTRELQCFFLKQDYKQVSLGVGVNIRRRGRMGTLESEFDLLSTEGFYEHNIRRSVQGVAFEEYLPLPISRGHWQKVKGDVPQRLNELIKSANLGAVAPVQAIYNFMTDVVVNLNQQAAKPSRQALPCGCCFEETSPSSLAHASEKAIESYFHLFHLLLCLAADQPGIVTKANQRLREFINGATSKDDCPNLGHLLVASLISDIPITEKILKSIIKETVTRNVVWMLDKKGAGMVELAYMEPAPVSFYRLQETFNAGITSYRLLMFLDLFRRVAVGSNTSTSSKKSLTTLRDEAFDRHGAPPKGEAKNLAESIRRIQKIDNFPAFLKEMGIAPPTAEWFTTFLRDCVKASQEKGYHFNRLTEGEALWLRQQKEANVAVRKGVIPRALDEYKSYNLSFFPGAQGVGGGGRGRGGRGGQGGRGRGRGGYQGRGRGRGGY